MTEDTMLHLLPSHQPASAIPSTTLLGPVLYRQGGYAYDRFTVEDGLSRSYSYRTIEEAIYDRKVTLRGVSMVGCATSDVFETKCAEMMPDDLRLCA
jgi:hypothetical protein